VTRNGEPINRVGVKDSIDPNISYSRSFGEWEAAVAAGLDLWEWENNEYPRWFKARVIAWHRLHGLIELHTQDAVARKSRRKGGK
jgi:hypothetical protein